MKIRGLLLLLPVLLIILLNVIWGSVISWMLSISIVACLLYYIAQINIEQLVYRKTNNAPDSDALRMHVAGVIKKYKAILTFTLLTVVFISSIFCIYRTTNPGGLNPWFFNNDYHGISNNGMVFQKSLVVDTKDGGTFTIQKNGNEPTLVFNNYLKPVFVATEQVKVYTPVNNVYPNFFQQQFTIANGKNSLLVNIKKDDASFFSFLKKDKRRNITYEIELSSNDPFLAEMERIALPFKDKIELKDVELVEGKLLYNLFLNNPSFNSSRGEAYVVLEYMLRQMGDVYLLSNYNNSSMVGYSIFPSVSYVQNGYKLLSDGQPQAMQATVKASMALDKHFYIGFHNPNEKVLLTEVSADEYRLKEGANYTALLYDYPPVYLLTSPSTAQHKGNKNLRFIANSNDNVLESELKEGFLFKNFGLNNGYAISGNMDYLTGQPNAPLHFGISDNNRNSIYQKVDNGKFSLQCANSDTRYLFSVRDFSKNGFEFKKLLLFSCLIYLGILSLLLFFPGKKLVRIEPIIFVVIYVLSILRFILYWRLATFPPIEGISKYELENTILNFDYKLGVQLPLPLTLIWIYVLLIGLAIYRYLAKMGKAPTIRFKRMPLQTMPQINKAFLLFMSGCLVLNFINNNLLHIEVLVRIVTILLPILGYCFFATKANQQFVFEQDWIHPSEAKWKVRVKAYFHYFMHNPTFILTLVTILFFAITDRGFAILFTLFILLKNIFLNFLKKPFNSQNTNLKRMLLQPNNYWVFGIAALVLYLVVLSFKSLFYYLLTYKFVVIGLAILIPAIVIYFFYTHLRKWAHVLFAAFGVYFLLISIPPTRSFVDAKITGVIKHVQFRASIIHQPISELLAQNGYSSFQTKKIIETAENQWFINSYISKPYDNDAVINLRPYTKVGVDYNTQTRDVVIARFVIGELGNFTMYLILLLVLLPLIIYLLSYKLTSDVFYKLHAPTYAGVLPLLIIFTLSLFVWLTATNRFVFFGQDFPFLSLTSKLSVLLPVLLYGITLLQEPETYRSHQINWQANVSRYAFFTALVAGFALTTIKGNQLSGNNFSIIVPQTQERINKDLNAVLSEVQDSLSARKVPYSYTSLIKALGKHKSFDKLLSETSSDKYTKSILELLINKPASAFQVDNPLYIVYDNYEYTAKYNEHLYLQLPPVENRKVWHGSITENLNLFAPLVNISYNNANTVTALPYFKNDVTHNIQLGIIPPSWLVKGNKAVGIINVNGNLRQKAEVFLYKNMDNNIIQTSTAFANTVLNEDLVSVSLPQNKFLIRFNNSGNYFAVNKWVNGKYKILYPQKEQNFWMYQFANAIRNGYQADSLMLQNVAVSLDYKLLATVQQQINATYSTTTQANKRFKFSVIAADGTGNIRLMNDYVTNRKVLDPNDAAAIYALQQQHFFFSNTRNERDQWGNSNLLSMHLGPGSSIKPLTTAVIASQVNAGWEQLRLLAPVQAQYENYAGFKLLKPWENDDHYRAGTIGIDKFLEVSSNFYQSAMIFLGAYSKDAFMTEDGKASLGKILSSNAGTNNTYPVFEYGGKRLYLPNYNKRKGNWPATNPNDKKAQSYFGNENAIMANGFEINVGLRTKDKDKAEQEKNSGTKINMLDSFNYALLSANKGSAFLWSMPEQATLLQTQRGFSEPYQNFNLGLKTVTLGGYPYQVAPYKMLDMYLSLFTQNRNFSLQVIPKKLPQLPWQVDDTWQGRAAFNRFLANNVFKGMSDVVYGSGGTARALAVLKAIRPDLYIYAKTGTINEQGSGAKNSRRLIVVLSNKDMQQAENIGKPDNRFFSFYFAVDNNKDFDWNLLLGIIRETMSAPSFNNYFGK